MERGSAPLYLWADLIYNASVMISVPIEINNYTYIVRCSDGTLYTGWTNNLVNRLKAHNSGRGGKYTKSRFPVELVYYEISETKEQAMSREWHIKQLTREEKEKLIINR